MNWEQTATEGNQFFVFNIDDHAMVTKNGHNDDAASGGTVASEFNDADGKAKNMHMRMSMRNVNRKGKSSLVINAD